MRIKLFIYLIIFFICDSLLMSCSLAPRYSRPEVKMPVTYKETSKKTSSQWRKINSQQQVAMHPHWWRMYRDPTLNILEEKVMTSNQHLKAALARYEKARAVAAVARAAYFPTVIGNLNASRQQASNNLANPLIAPLYGDQSLGADFAYEIDIWGRVRNSVAAAQQLSAASAADLAAMQLSLQAELAKNYFALKNRDRAQQILNQTVNVYEKALAIVRQRYAGKIVSMIEVDEAESQLQTVKVKAADNQLKRAQLEHAIAILIGEAPAFFTIAPTSVTPRLVEVNSNLPSTLLERRPDIAKAEHLVQAANAGIGVARAAYFPMFNLTGGIGFESATFSNLLKGSSLVWALGPTSVSPLFSNESTPLAALTLIDGGRINALTNKARAKYLETVANYKQTVLTALQEVEDQLVALRQLQQETKYQRRAVTTSQRAAQQALYRYQGGLTTYLDVVVPQNMALQAELNAIDIQNRYQLASVQLVKALGGDWNETEKKNS